MIAWSLLLFLAAVVGHTAIWVFGINWLYGTRFRGWWVTLLRHVFQGLIALGPFVFLFRWGPQLVADHDWFMLPAWLLLYLSICWLLGFVVMPYQTVKRWCRQVPVQQLANHTATVDVAAQLGDQLGDKLHGPCKHGWYARLPGNQIHQVDFTERVYRLPQLPTAWDGLTILHITDLHLCGCPDRRFYEFVQDRCALEPVDLLALTGDILDSEEHYHWIMPVLGRLRWREAAFAVLGNHDSWLDVPRIHRRLERLGIRMIGGLWEQVTVRGEPLIVIGNEMPWLPPTPDLSACPAQGFRLCLSHSPDTLPWARRHRIDLMLAGHNHGGQIRFPGIGPMLVPSRYSRRYDYGTFYEPPTLLHVSRGLGGTYPLRYNCRPEVTRLVLRAGTPAGKPAG